MAGRVYRRDSLARAGRRPTRVARRHPPRRLSVPEAALADQWHEGDRTVIALAPFVPVARDDDQVLVVARSDGNDQPTAVGVELHSKRRRDGGRGRRNEDPAPRLAIGCPDAPVADAALDGPVEPEIAQSFPR